MPRFTTPNITPAQWAAVSGWIVAQLVAWGLIPREREQLAISAGATVLAACWKLADAHIRNGRARGSAVRNHVHTETTTSEMTSRGAVSASTKVTVSPVVPAAEVVGKKASA